MGESAASAKLGRIERAVEEQLRSLAEAGELRGLPGEGRPLPADEGGPRETWAARHIAREAGVTPEWVLLRREIDEGTKRLRRRIRAHRASTAERARSLAHLPADRILEAARGAEARDARVRRDIIEAVEELNALIRRYDLLVIPTLQLPLLTLDLS